MTDASRFKATGTINLDGTLLLGEWVPPSYREPNERLYIVTQADIDRPDLIAERTLKNVDYWWMVLHYNQITDPFSLEVGDRLRIPSWAWGEVTPAGLVTTEAAVERAPLTSLSLYAPPPYQTADTAVQQAQVAPVTVFNLSIQIPPCDFGNAHLELQLSTDPSYNSVKMSRLTAASIDRWFYYDPWANQGAGSHLPFPPAGLNLSVYAGQPVYFRITVSDNLTLGVQYYPRFRFIIADVDTQWVGLPPITLAPD